MEVNRTLTNHQKDNFSSVTVRNFQEDKAHECLEIFNRAIELSSKGTNDPRYVDIESFAEQVKHLETFSGKADLAHKTLISIFAEKLKLGYNSDRLALVTHAEKLTPDQLEQSAIVASITAKIIANIQKEAPETFQSEALWTFDKKRFSLENGYGNSVITYLQSLTESSNPFQRINLEDITHIDADILNPEGYVEFGRLQSAKSFKKDRLYLGPTLDVDEKGRVIRVFDYHDFKQLNDTFLYGYAHWTITYKNSQKGENTLHFHEKIYLGQRLDGTKENMKLLNKDKFNALIKLKAHVHITKMIFQDGFNKELFEGLKTQNVFLVPPEKYIPPRDNLVETLFKKLTKTKKSPEEIQREKELFERARICVGKKDYFLPCSTPNEEGQTLWEITEREVPQTKIRKFDDE